MIELEISNRETMEGMNSCIPTDCTIHSSGNVSCVMPCKHSAYCDGSDYTYWPFDVQKCHFSYVPRIRHVNQLVLLNRSVEINLGEFGESGVMSQDWKLISVSARNEIFPDEFNATHPSITINFDIERHSRGYINQIIIPAVVLSIVNIFLLSLNPEFPDRVVAYVINLFAHFIFVEQLKWM